MTMTKVDFEREALEAGELIAFLEADRRTALRVVRAFSKVSRASNGRFDSERFERVTLAHAARYGWDPLAAAPAPVRDACGYVAPEATCGVVGPHTAHGTGAVRCSGVRGGVRVAS